MTSTIDKTILPQHVQSAYEDQYPFSKSKHAILREYIPNGHPANVNAFSPYPLFIERGNEAYVYTHEGHKLLDVINGYSVFVHGHIQEQIYDTILPELKKGFFFCSPTTAQIEFSELLATRVPSLEKLRITNCGTEATMYALRTARAYTKRSKILKFLGGYHGTHDTAIASTAKDPLTDGLPSHAAEDIIEIEFNDFEKLSQIFQNQGDLIAAVIIEPYIGGGGTICPMPGFLELLRALCDKYGTILIFDEIVTFRLHEGGAQKYFGVEADLVTYGKFIGGGFPIGVFGGKAELMNIYDSKLHVPMLPHGGTFFGYEAAMLAGAYILKNFSQKDINYLNDLGDYFAKSLKTIISKKELHIQVNQVGSILTLHYTPSEVTNVTLSLTSEKKLAKLIHIAFLTRNIFTAPFGKYYILSTCMNKSLIDQITSSYEDILTELYPYIEQQFPHLIRK